MPRNSVGVLYTDGAGSPMSTIGHVWKFDPSHAQHVGMFSPANTSCWYWPQGGGVRVANATYVVAWRMENGPPGLFPFATAAVDVMRVPDGDPSDWPAALPTTTIGSYINDSFTVGNAVTADADDGFIYLLGGEGSGPSHAIMTRITPAAFAAGTWDALTFLCADGVWRPYAAGQALTHLFDDVPSETTMTYVPALAAWALPIANTFTSSSIMLRTAPHPAGPWSAAEALFPIPPALLSNGSFCYAAKMHPELSKSANEFITSFNCNTPDLNGLLDRPEVYIPRILRSIVA